MHFDLYMIKVQSFIQDKNSLVPVEVELALWPGLPCIQFVGLPDQHLKESAIRIKSAIKSCGFQFPIAQQILVNLRPSHLKKTSRGLELAVAAAFLWETQQIKKPVLSSDFFVYGELGLSGNVIEPEDLPSSFQSPYSIVLTGENTAAPVSARFRRQIVKSLEDLSIPIEVKATAEKDMPERPHQSLKRKFSLSQARLLEILAVGEHSALIAGPAGSGKSTIASCLPSLLKAPSAEEFLTLKKIHHAWGEKLNWRPIVKPHHSTPLIAMVGGGSVPFAGEISRAHGGVLILDELLEFAPQVQEALREPFEEGKMRVLRNGRLQEYPAQAQILATTNLCPCGTWTPLKASEKICSFSQRKCRSFGPRLSGPFVDRFEILEFTDSIGELEVSGQELFQKIAKAQKFSQIRSQNFLPNSRQSLDRILEKESSDALLAQSQKLSGSQRRKMASLRVARTIADLEFSEKIKMHHWDEAVQKCQVHFEMLRRWD